MQATNTTRHFGPRQIKQATLAIAILTSTAIGVTTATIVRDASDNDTGRSTIVTNAAANRQELFGYQFMEQNLNLPASTAVPAANPNMDYRFREMNLELPGAVSSVTPNWRVIEENRWGENFVFAASTGESIYPSADDVPQQLSGEVAY